MKHKRRCIEKRAFGTLAHAKSATISIYKTFGQKLNVYECSMCLDFHLTRKRTELGCLLDYKFAKKHRKKHRRKSAKLFSGRVTTMQLIKERYEHMKRLIKGLVPRRISQLKGTLPLIEQKRLLHQLHEKNNII